MKRVILFTAIFPIIFLSCSTINEEGKAFTDENIARYPQSGRVFDAAATFARKEWREGQWVAYRGVMGEKSSFVKYTVLEKVGDDSFWLQVESADYSSPPSLVQLLIKGYDPLDPRDMRIAAAKVRDDTGQMMDVPMFAGSIFRYVLQNLLIDVTGSITEDVRVPAGTFNGSFRITADVYFGPFRVTSTVWFHPEIPVMGYAKSESTAGDQVMELLDFGE